jgi:hypothetical protein
MIDLLDHGLSGVVLEPDLQQHLARVAAHREVVNVALVFQHPGNRHFQLGRRHRDGLLLRLLRVANARQHVGNRIAHTHQTSPDAATSSP